MKKIFRYTILLAAALTILPSCKNEEEMIFEDSAANRLDQAKEDNYQLLCSNGGKWMLEYFANSDEPGYVYLVTFKPSGEVSISGNNKWIGDTYRNESSLWNVIADDGVVLTFNSYNSIFHVLADPDNYSDTSSGQTEDSAVDHTGDGHLGDYEFIILGVSEDGNTVTLKGKKRGYYHYLRRLPADTDDQEYVAAIVAQSSNLFASKIKTNYLTLPSGERFTVSYSKGIMSACPEGGDAITQTEQQPCIITLQGLRFLNDFAISRVNPSDSIRVRNFLLRDDGTLQCTDIRGATISSGPLAELIYTPGYTWRADLKTLTGSFDLLNTAATELKANGGTFSSADFLVDTTDPEAPTLNLMTTIRIKIGKQTVNAKLNFRFNVTTDGDKITLAYAGPDSAASSYADKMPSILTLIDALDGATLTLSAANRLATTVMTLTAPDAATAILTIQ